MNLDSKYFKGVATTPSTDRTVRDGLATTAASIVVRGTGIVRELSLAFVFGAGPEMDAWQVASRVPGALRDLVGEGTMTSAFIPTLLRVDANEGAGSARQLSDSWMTFLTLGFSAVGVAMWFGSGFAARHLAAGYAGEKQALVGHLIALLSPILAATGVWALHAALLQVRGRSAWSVLTFGVINLTVLAAALADPVWRRLGISTIDGVAAATVVGTLCAALLARFGLGTAAPRFVFSAHPAVTDLLWRVVPAGLAVGAVQLTALFDAWLGSSLGDGPIAHLGYAFRLTQLPMTLLAGSVALASLPGIAGDAARGDLVAARARAADACGFTLWMLAPCAAVLAIHPDGFVRLLFERGAFSAHDTSHTAECVRAYAFGLIAFGLHRVLVPAAWGLGLHRAPVVAAIAGIVIKLPLAYTLSRFGAVGLAWSHTLTFTLELGLLVVWISVQAGQILRPRELVTIALATALASLVAAVTPLTTAATLTASLIYLFTSKALGISYLDRLRRRESLPPHIDARTRQALAHHARGGATSRVTCIVDGEHEVRLVTDQGTLILRPASDSLIAESEFDGSHPPPPAEPPASHTTLHGPLFAGLDIRQRPPPLVAVRVGEHAWAVRDGRLSRTSLEGHWIEVAE